MMMCALGLLDCHSRPASENALTVSKNGSLRFHYRSCASGKSSICLENQASGDGQRKPALCWEAVSLACCFEQLAVATPCMGLSQYVACVRGLTCKHWCRYAEELRFRKEIAVEEDEEIGEKLEEPSIRR